MIDDILAKFEGDTGIVLESVSLTRDQKTNYHWRAEVKVYVNDGATQKVLGKQGNFVGCAEMADSAKQALLNALVRLVTTLREEGRRRKELPPQPFALAIKFNNTGTGEMCKICGQWFDMEVGPALFKQDSYEPVCLDCGRKYEPGLVKILNTGFYEMDEIPF